MGSRKDILKNLGIPEYPWSSDDDEPPSDPRPAPIIQPRPNVMQASTSTASPGTMARAHMQTSDAFISMLMRRAIPNNNNEPISPYIPARRRSRSDDNIPLSYLSRTTHTPAPELRERASGRADLDIQRVLAFKRLTRNINAGRYPRYGVPRGASRPGSVVPSESNSSNSGSVRLPYYNRRVNRSATTNNIPGSARQIIVDHGPSQPRQSAEHHRRTHNWDNEAADNGPSTSRAALAATSPVADVEAPAETDPEPEPQVSSNNTSGTGVSLEEEIVEIEVEPTTVNMDLIDRARPAMPSTSNHDLASTSMADVVDSGESEQQNHGVKRKRRESAEDKGADPFTVKDFNQSLLRLLECPVCLEWMEPPMSQCRRGHLVCNRCRARLAACPVCRTTFSSVRNRAMEGVAEMLRYPCRHGCGREVRLRRRTPHEASCAARKYQCPVPLCADKQAIARDQLAAHFHSKHLHLVKLGPRHHFGIKVSSEAHDNWLIMALDEFFHMKVDVDIRTWGIIVYVAYIGPKCNAVDYAYEVSIDGQHNSRRMLYRRATHSDLESSSLNVSRQDCFHLTLDQALNFIRFKNRHCDAEKFLEFDVEISKIDPPPSRDDSDS